MREPQGMESQTVYGYWSGWWTGMLGYQWRVLETQYQLGLRIMETALGTTTGRSEGFEKLERIAEERVGQGLAPPPEIYQAPYRRAIDWSRFPDWARPSDPELFEGGHEG